MRNFRKYKKISFFSHNRIQSIQQRFLRKHLVYCKEHSPFYQRLFKRHKINPEKTSLDNLCDLPFTDKEDIERNNDEFFATSPERIVDIVLSSGTTTGKPTKIVYTESDLKRLAYNEEKSFLGCGFTAKDVVLLTCTLDRCFVAGLAYYLGIRAVGATAIRNGLNSLESHGEVIQRMRPTAIVGVPSFIRKLGIFLDEEKRTAQKKNVSKLVCIGEPLRGEDLRFLKLGKDLEEIWNAKAYSTYSSSEIVTTFCECAAQQGGHLHPDLAVIEIVDDNGALLGAGEKGEIVVTPMSIEGMPLVRFKTGDISFIIDKPCSCGRNTLMLGPILGRKQQMMKVHGTTIYPQAIYSALEEIGGVKEYYITVTSESELSDAIEVHLAVEGSSCAPETIQDKLQARLRVKPRVLISDEGSIREQVYNPKSRKPIHFIDRRR
ncbi:phenylacetate--CoA ligase family protein [bacterium]|nr:MAG: phenylacetate--CoA ligase family protein [bacterium]